MAELATRYVFRLAREFTRSDNCVSPRPCIPCRKGAGLHGVRPMGRLPGTRPGPDHEFR